MAHHNRYWSCSKFADWVRGTPKLKVGTGDEWGDWHKLAKSSHRVRYWIAEEALDNIQDFVTWPVRKIYDLKYYVNNRWITRTHSLTAHPKDIRPGNWQDVGNRFLPCLFNELVNFVEVELAWWHIAWDDEAKKKYQAPFWASGWFRWRTWRCPEAGLNNLKWQMSLTIGEDWGIDKDHKDYGKPTHQAKSAKEVYDLYMWWTTVYPNRPDPHDASGWSAYCEAKRELRDEDGEPYGFFSDRGETKEMRKERDRALKLSRKIEEQYRKEDEQMMVRLIKVRDSLWT